MARSETEYLMRLRPDQLQPVAQAKKLRAEVIKLRAKVSEGSYGDAELRRFWRLAETAGLILFVSNTELSERAGVGANFFSTVARDKRRPKLHNFLRALTVLLEVANERLADVDGDQIIEKSGSEKISERIRQDRFSLLQLARSLAQVALDEIEKLDAERPNDPERISAHERQRELFHIFADGFTRIARALAVLEIDRAEPAKLRKATKIVEAVGEKFNKWWKKNGDEAIDWSVRIPVITAGVAALGWAGAPMALGTSIVAALVGGEKVMNVISRRSSKAPKG
ncbi:hypothetical protein [Bradyrhizobium sp. Y36]|uniref:hypothetical protein n=1 Tax=Bradyrhizobium sp. Y36 TaxID=2035447 RepID=UPI001177CEEA|nr:hypothetical protein [Bradyrhizobium sp. Y36]